MPRTTWPHKATTYDGAGYWLARGGLKIPENIVNPPSPQNINRPISMTMTGSTNAAKIASLQSQGLTHLPSSANLVLWPYSNPDGALLNVWLETLGANDIGVLPEKLKPDSSPWFYQIDSSKGFKRNANPGDYYWMGKFTKGVIGLGPDCYVTTTVSSFTAPQQPIPFIDPVDGTTKTGVQSKVLNTYTVGAYVANFEMRGRSFGGIAYNAFALRGGGIIERMYFNGAHRGFRNSPNGEAGAVNWYSASSEATRSGAAYNTEVECRDSTGARVGTSPLMFNNLPQGVTMVDCYLHHSYAGMPTSWTCSGGITYTRVRSEYNGSGGGSLNGSCFNFEICSGTATLTDCTMICNYLGSTDSSQGTGNTEFHMSGGSDVAKLTINLINCTIDKGPRPRNIAGSSLTAADGTFTLAWQLFGPNSYNPEKGFTVNRYAADGTTVLPTFQYGTITG